MRASHVYLVCSLILAGSTLLAQDREQQLFNRLAKGKENVSPAEMVSFKSDYPYTKAIQELSDLAKKFTGKIIVDTSPIKNDDTRQLGTNIQSMYWRDALEVILRTNGNWYEEDPTYFLVFDIREGKKEASPLGEGGIQGGGQKGLTQAAGNQNVALQPIDSSKYYAQAKEVTVSAILLQINQSKLNQHGITFSILRGNDVNMKIQLVGADLTAANTVDAFKTPQFNAQVSPTPGKMVLDVNAALSFFETEGYGEIVSRPVIRVRAGGSSSIQIGQSIPFLTKDFQGNTIQTFVDAGTILKVSPKIYNYNGVDFIDLRYDLDKSSAGASATGGLEIDHNKVSGSLYMLDGERTYVSGLINSTQTTNRTGVPFLKDLPWWVFGLRYIFGADQASVIKSELIIILDAKIEPDIETRATMNLKGTQKSVDDRQKQLREDTEKLMKKDH